MLGLIKTALGIGSGISWITYVVVAGLGFAAGAGATWWIEETRIDGYQRQIEAARLESDLHEADANRWQQAASDRDATIATLKTALDQQSAAISAGRAKEQALRDALRRANEQNTVLQGKADQLSRDLADEAAKAPGDVREIGPIVSRRAPKLFE